jgi:omega-6 fatty acid desaturase (delta-12 desaturase)
MDHLSIEKEISEKLKNWRKITSKYKKKSTKKAVLQILTSFLPFVAIWILMYFMIDVSMWIVLALGTINAFFLVRIFIIQHDCGHQSFFKSRKKNDLFGYICSVFSFLPFKYWAKTHNFHHCHTGVLETEHRTVGDLPTLTVDEYKNSNWWGRLKYRIFRMPLVTFVISPVYYFIVTTKFPILKFENKRKTYLMILKDNSVIIPTYIAAGFLIGWGTFLLIQFYILFIFGIIAFWFFYIQHQHEETYKKWSDDWNFLLSAVKGSSYYKLPKFFEWFTGNIGIHHIHHLSSIIPNYNLKACLVENPVLTQYTTTITFFDSLKMISHKLWDENQQRMISFREFYRLYK